jgi:hypothetical protein
MIVNLQRSAGRKLQPGQLSLLLYQSWEALLRILEGQVQKDLGLHGTNRRRGQLLCKNHQAISAQDSDRGFLIQSEQQALSLRRTETQID